MEYRIAAADDMELLLRSRTDTLRDVNRLDADYRFSEAFLEESRKYFLEGDQTTVLALDGDRVIGTSGMSFVDGDRAVGCASLCYITLMPTFSHPTGKRAHLMNVWTDAAYRRQGIASRMLEMLIREAWDRGVTEIRLDATASGRPLYRKLGFKDSGECMVLEK